MVETSYNAVVSFLPVDTSGLPTRVMVRIGIDDVHRPYSR